MKWKRQTCMESSFWPVSSDPYTHYFCLKIQGGGSAAESVAIPQTHIWGNVSEKISAKMSSRLVHHSSSRKKEEGLALRLHRRPPSPWGGPAASNCNSGRRASCLRLQCGRLPQITELGSVLDAPRHGRISGPKHHYSSCHSQRAAWWRSILGWARRRLIGGCSRHSMLIVEVVAGAWILSTTSRWITITKSNPLPVINKVQTAEKTTKPAQSLQCQKKIICSGTNISACQWISSWFFSFCASKWFHLLIPAFIWCIFFSMFTFMRVSISNDYSILSHPIGYNPIAWRLMTRIMYTKFKLASKIKTMLLVIWLINQERYTYRKML